MILEHRKVAHSKKKSVTHDEYISNKVFWVHPRSWDVKKARHFLSVCSPMFILVKQKIFLLEKYIFCTPISHDAAAISISSYWILQIIIYVLNHSSSQNSSQSEKSIWEPGPSLVKAEYQRWNSAPDATPCRAKTHCWSSDACWIELHCINIDHSWTDLKIMSQLYIYLIMILNKVWKIFCFYLKILIFSGNQLYNEYWTGSYSIEFDCQK